MGNKKTRLQHESRLRVPSLTLILLVGILYLIGSSMLIPSLNPVEKSSVYSGAFFILGYSTDAPFNNQSVS